jgi:hypothetical protein
MKKSYAFPFFSIITSLALIFTLSANSGCAYSFNDIAVNDSIKTFHVAFIGNVAPINNPQLSPNLTQRLKQKINSQTKLSEKNSENGADYFITGNIVRYDVSTTGVTQNQTNNGSRLQANLNRLTVGVKITLNNQLNGNVQEFDISRSFDFSATQSLQAAENALLEEMIRNLSDEIFNRIFSQW